MTRMPEWHQHAQMGRLPVCTPVDLPGLGARQLFPNTSFHSTKEKMKLVARAEEGRNREDPQNKWFRQLLETSPHPLLRAG